MTNAEKYKEVFGMPPDMKSCPTYKCLECPCCEFIDNKYKCNSDARMWWISAYKEINV